jgi:NADPH:quinone reductase-like Zn-dependent oxidoreductase
LIKSTGDLELSIQNVPVPALGDDEILVKVEATPINPTDIGLLFGAADVSTLTHSGGVTHVKVPAHLHGSFQTRVDASMRAGGEGAGTGVAAGKSAAAQGLIGHVVASWGGGFYGQYVVQKAGDVLPLPAGTTPAEGASAYVNPITVLMMVETTRREGHKAIVHTAAASNLGQMLVRVCQKDGIELVNIVRSAQQVKILQDIGAKYVLDSTSPTFAADLTKAIIATGATIAFDAIGGGTMADQILRSMEAAINKDDHSYKHYGSSVLKQVYIYGMLDQGPTTLSRRYGFVWSTGAWLLTTYLGRYGPETAQKTFARIASELKTTFASSYTSVISLDDVLKPEIIQVYYKKATG